MLTLYGITQLDSDLVKEVKDVGITTVDTSLKFNTYINAAVAKASSALTLLINKCFVSRNVDVVSSIVSL